jgi:hypothetical protein
MQRLLIYKCVSLTYNRYNPGPYSLATFRVEINCIRRHLIESNHPSGVHVAAIQCWWRASCTDLDDAIISMYCSISQPRRMVMWRETELATSPCYLLARHWHQRYHVDKHSPLLEYTNYLNETWAFLAMCGVAFSIMHVYSTNHNYFRNVSYELVFPPNYFRNVSYKLVFPPNYFSRRKFLS